MAALNPHAGAGGRFGSEDQGVLLLEVRFLQERGGGDYELTGALPADTLFNLQQATQPKGIFMLSFACIMNRD